MHRDAVVLLVDDQVIIGEAVRRILTGKPGIQFHFCQNGKDALAAAANLLPSVILQDLVMPDIDGLDLVQGYRAQEATKLTPLIVLSSKDEPAVKARAFELGANDYVIKLPDPLELVARVRYHSQAYYSMLQARAYAKAEKERLLADRQADMLRARNTLIFALAKLAESRDTDTGEHLERIAAYSRVLAEQLRVSRPELDDHWIMNLQLASSLHDIGKVGIPDGVLLKPGKLTPEERKIIERHPSIGAAALDAILARQPDDVLLRMARNIAACHHERWDGGGYPQGTRGESIPLEARIVSVVDVYDALTSKRIYKPAMSHAEAMAIIQGGKGTQFDPQIVDAMTQCEIVFQLAGQQLQREAHSAT